LAVTPIRPEPLHASTLTQRLADSLYALDASTLSSDVTNKAKLCIFDFLACAFASRSLPWCRHAVALACNNSAHPDGHAASIIGTNYVVSVHDAAFANAVLGHALVRDDMHLGSVSHLGVVAIPSLLALAERHEVPGQRLLAAIAVAYETGGKLGRAILDVDVSRIFRPTGITGPLAAAAGGAKLLGLNADSFANALGFAANMPAGYNEWAAAGGSEMFFHPGFAARNALAAVELAALGAHASATALDGAAGLLAAFGKPLQPQIPMPFEDREEILAVFFKEVPACNFAQTAAQAAREIAMREEVLSADIERVLVRVPYAAASYPGCNVSGPFEHILQAKMSIHYNVAAALCTGNFDERNYLPNEQPEISRVAKLVELIVDDELTAAFPGKQGAEVIVETIDGNRVKYRADDVTPANNTLVRDRFRTAAEQTLGSGTAEQLEHFIDDIESAPDAGQLARLTRTGTAG